MTCSDCPRPRTITLTDGATCCSFCERHRAECEARWLLAKPDKILRRLFLDGNPNHPGKPWDPLRKGVRGMRGAAAVTELENLARKIWEAARGN